MNLLITITDPERAEEYIALLKRYHLPTSVELQGHGTATHSMLNLLGLDTSLRRAVFSIVSQEITPRIMAAARRELYIDAPGHGIVIAVPLKSVGGAKTLEYLGGNEGFKSVEHKNEFENELIVVVANEGMSDMVMDAARGAGARGGTVLHGKSAAKDNTSRFFNVNLINEREIVLIVSTSRDKSTIMSAILHEAGPSTKAGGIVFSLPVSDALGLKSSCEEEAQ